MVITVGALAMQAFGAGHAFAQTVDTRVFDTVVPFSYDRGRNIGVVDRARPEYDVLGVPVGGFTAYPALEVSGGYDDNVYQTQNDTKSDAFAIIAPSLRLLSNWSVNSLQLDTSGTFRRYANNPSRNQNGWSVGATGRFDIDTEKTIQLRARSTRLFENSFSGAAANNLRTADPVQASTFQGIGDIRFSRLRLEVAGDYSIFNFQAVTTMLGVRLRQDNRDRSVARVLGHVEYGLTPETGIFVELRREHIDYRTFLLNGQPNRDSYETSALLGSSADISSLLRGSLGLGYVWRNYRSNLYNEINGFSFDGRLEYFFTPLTTITLTGRRQIEESFVADSSGFFANEVAVHVDHELLRNLLLSAAVSYEVDDYRGIDGKATILQISGGTTYMITNVFRLLGTIGYARRTSDNAVNGPRLDQVQATVGVSARF